MFSKTIISIMILVFICLSQIQAQRGIDGEILCETTNTSGATYKFEIKPVSGKTAWCQSSGEWYIVTSTSTESLEITGDVCYDNDYVFDVCYASGGSNPEFWLTFNEFTIYKKIYGYYWDEKISFYIDYRDCNYGLGGPLGGGNRDITFIIDGSDYKTYYLGGTGDNECDLEDYTEVTDGDTLKIWIVNDFTGPHDISCMCATPSLISITNYNNRPKVLWRHEDDPNGSYSYEVWRQLTPFLRPRDTWSLIDTITDTSFVDNEISIGSGTTGRAYYKIRAKIDDLKSGYSSYDYINYGGILKPFVQNSDAIDVSEFKLYTNYPNPFNPSTKISFDISEKAHVELAVFDIQGKKVVTLVNEMLGIGTYSVEFNAGQLPSGTYLYKIVAGDFTDTQKMILVK